MTFCVVVTISPCEQPFRNDVKGCSHSGISTARNFSQLSSGSSDRVRGGARNMKSMRPPSVAIFFMTYFHRAGKGGPWPPRLPLDPLLQPVGCVGFRFFVAIALCGHLY